MYPLFYKLGKTILVCFSGKNVVFQMAAFFLTYAIVISGFDWWYYVQTRGALLSLLLSPAIWLGFILPLIVPPILYVLSKIKKSDEGLRLTWALVQAEALGWILSSTYKAFTGRTPPVYHGAETLLDTSRDFNFGFLEHGIFWGWPSSHTTVAFAMACTIIALYPRIKPLTLLALSYAFYIGFGISISIHWFSEFIAGAIFGAIIGTVVGTHFRNYSK